MENIKNITILENDTLHEHCQLSRVLKDYIKTYKDIKFDIWEWFSQDTIQNKEQSIARLKTLSKDENHIFLTHPSFIGYDNTFSGWVWFMDKLRENGIKLKLYVIFGNKEEDLLGYVLKYIQDEKGYSTFKDNMEELKNALLGHEIHYTTYDKSSSAYLDDKDMFETFSLLTYDDVKNRLHKKGDKVRIKSTGEVKEVIYSYYWKTISGSKVDLIMDADKHAHNESISGKADSRSSYDRSAYQEFKLTEVEKV